MGIVFPWFRPDVKAMITLTRKNSVMSGYRPAHNIGGYLTTGVQQYLHTNEVKCGETVEGIISFITPEAYPHTLEAGMRLVFQEGKRETGYADILEVYNDLLKKE